MVRKANKNDVSGIMNLLFQVDAVHHDIRPDLFKGNTAKYTEQELVEILQDDQKPIFVYDEGQILGHAFCQVSEYKDHRLMSGKAMNPHTSSTRTWVCGFRKQVWKLFCRPCSLRGQSHREYRRRLENVDYKVKNHYPKIIFPQNLCDVQNILYLCGKIT